MFPADHKSSLSDWVICSGSFPEGHASAHAGKQDPGGILCCVKASPMSSHKNSKSPRTIPTIRRPDGLLRNLDFQHCGLDIITKQDFKKKHSYVMSHPTDYSAGVQSPNSENWPKQQRKGEKTVLFRNTTHLSGLTHHCQLIVHQIYLSTKGGASPAKGGLT